MDDELIRELMNELITETNEGLDQLEQDLLLLEDGSDEDAINRVFRVIHTIKGSSGSLGLDKIESLAHKGENLLDQVRNGEIPMTPDLTSLLLRTLDSLRAMFEILEETGSQGEEDYADLQKELIDAYENPGAGAPEEKAEEKAAESDENKGWGLFDDEDEAPAAEKKEETSGQGWGLFDDDDDTPAPKAVAEKKEKPKAEKKAAPKKSEALVSKKPAAKGPVETSIRVDVTQLDDLMNLVGELVLTRNQILQQTGDLEDDVSLTRAAQRLNTITTDLQQGMMKTRMQPIGNAWTKFPRVVRDLAGDLGKKIRLEMEGQETELDRSLIEAIKDPLIHIVRNSVDHGIEDPDTRVAAGKDAEGMLHIAAYHDSGQVIIEINDNGGGVKVDKVKAKAVDVGIITEEQAETISDREVVNLIFHAGFSTADKVSNVSGRGVGMDVVRTNIEKIGGSVEMQSSEGEGTSLKIKIPLTLAIIPALIVSSAGERFAIPQISLQELVRLESDGPESGIETLYGSKVYRLRGALLPLVYLDEVLGLRKPGEDKSELKEVCKDGVCEKQRHLDDSVNIVVLHAEGQPFGLVVDAISDSEEIVVKPLSKQLEDISCFAGATVMGDGKVCLILDTGAVAQLSHAVHAKHKQGQEEDDDEHQAYAGQKTELLVFSVGTGGRMTAPLSMISRIEEIQASHIEHVRGETVVQHRGQILSLIDAAKYIDGIDKVSYEDTDAIQVIVYTEDDHSIGLIVKEVLDIVNTVVELEDTSVTEGIMGSMVIDEKVTDFLDLSYIMKKANPKLLASADAE